MDTRTEELKQEIARRIRPVMPDTPRDEFDQLVARMATLQRKYEHCARADFFGAKS